MNKHRQNASFLFGLTVVLLLAVSCKKINESTELGGNLIPSVDNIHTFETFFSVETDNVNALFSDTTKVLVGDPVALGYMNDPEFGQTHADAYFTISPYQRGTYPFINKDSVVIDSVILSLNYYGSYGDTNSLQTVRVYEIDQNSGFTDAAYYMYNGSGFATTGAELGSKTFSLTSLKDSGTIIRGSDTTKFGNMLRIKLSDELGQRLANYDTAYGPNGGYKSDSIFSTLFRGLAIKADNSGNSLGYFNVYDNSKTKLTVYFRVTKNGVIDTTSTDFVHSNVHPKGVANPILRTPAGGWASYLANSTTQDDKIYLQSTPGSYANIRIPALDTFRNNVIHHAELIIYKEPSASEDVFTQPAQLMLDKINNTKDSAFTLANDLTVVAGASIPFTSFGGQLKSDNTYRFNISRHIQGIITRKEPNYTLRIYAPLRANVYTPNLGLVSIPVGDRIADGRVVMYGGNYADPALRMKVHIIYSTIN